MKLGGTTRATKKMTLIDNGPCPCRNYGETAVFLFLPKSRKQAQNAFFWKGYFFAQLCLVVARAWFRQRNEHFFQAPKLVFCPWPFVALGETIDLAPSDWFSTFRFQVTPAFVKKSSPIPNSTMGAPSASNSPSALSAQSTRAGKLKTSTAKYWAIFLFETRLALLEEDPGEKKAKEKKNNWKRKRDRMFFLHPPE